MPGDSTARPHGPGWRSRASWAETAHVRMSTSHSSPADGSSISPTTRIDHRRHGGLPYVRHDGCTSDIASDTELTGELAHRERLDSALVCEAGSAASRHAVPREGRRGLESGSAAIGIDKLTVYV